MRVLEGKQRPVERRAPPGDARAHPWAGDRTTGPSVYLDADLAERLRLEADSAARSSEETMSLLVGDRFVDPSTGTAYPVALARVTGPLHSGETRVRFDTEGFEAVARALAEVPFDYLLVGWFHSHVGLGCVPSGVDLATHRRYFTAPHQFAFVLDPVKQQAAAYTLEGGEFVPRPLRIFGPTRHRA